jgi:hypothetical protein
MMIMAQNLNRVQGETTLEKSVETKDIEKKELKKEILETIEIIKMIIENLIINLEEEIIDNLENFVDKEQIKAVKMKIGTKIIGNEKVIIIIGLDIIREHQILKIQENLVAQLKKLMIEKLKEKKIVEVLIMYLHPIIIVKLTYKIHLLNYKKIINNLKHKLMIKNLLLGIIGHVLGASSD